MPNKKHAAAQKKAHGPGSKAYEKAANARSERAARGYIAHETRHKSAAAAKKHKLKMSKKLSVSKKK